MAGRRRAVCVVPCNRLTAGSSTVTCLGSGLTWSRPWGMLDFAFSARTVRSIEAIRSPRPENYDGFTFFSYYGIPVPSHDQNPGML